MKRWTPAILLLFALLAGMAWIGTRAIANAPQPEAQQPDARGQQAWQRVSAADQARFATIDITIDPQGKPLGAFQFELTAAQGSFTVVGVEAGGHAAFNHGRPPYFDRTAERINTDKLIVAEYALPSLDADALPTKATRVVTVHVMLEGAVAAEPDTLQLKLTAAGDADGKPIDATAHASFRNPERPE